MSTLHETILFLAKIRNLSNLMEKLIYYKIYREALRIYYLHLHVYYPG